MSLECASARDYFADLYQAYATLLPRWFRRLRVSPNDVADAEQDLWLEVGAEPEQIPRDASEARKALFKLAARVAERLRRKTNKEAARRDGNIDPDALALEANLDERASDALALFDALERLDELSRRIVVASKVLGYSETEIAAQTGLTVHAVRLRQWRACARLSKAKKREARGVLLAPLAFTIEPEIGAALCAIYAAEGRLPQFGGPGGPLPPSTPKPAPKPRSVRLLACVTPPLVVLAFLALFALGAGLGLVWALLARPTERPQLVRAGLFVPRLALEVSCAPQGAPSASAPPSTSASTPRSTTSPFVLDTTALEALGKTSFSPGKGSQ